MNYFYCCQCKDKTSGKIGCFIFGEDNPFVAISPVFDDVVEIFTYMKGKFSHNEYEDNKYVPFRIKQIAD